MTGYGYMGESEFFIMMMLLTSCQCLHGNESEMNLLHGKMLYGSGVGTELYLHQSEHGS